MTIELIGPTFKPQDKIIESLCVFLHGWGSNGDDLISLAPIMSNELSNMLFVSPNAPEPCPANPSGRQWFDIMEREEGIDKPIGSIRNYISNLKKTYSIKNNKIFLFGFSQGAMIALHYGLREIENFGGILAFSGSLISPQRSSEVKNKTDVLLVHGELDEVEYVTDERFGFEIPTSCEGVPAEVLIPRQTWASGESYDAMADKLASMFNKNFERYSEGVSEAVNAAAPQN